MQIYQPNVVAITVISVEQLQAVYAVLGDPKWLTAAKKEMEIPGFSLDRPVSDEHKQGPTGNEGGNVSTASATQEEKITEKSAPETQEVSSASPSEPEVDSDGLPFDPDTMTGTKLKSGQWRMKNGIERPAPPASAAETVTLGQSPSVEPVGEETAEDANTSSDEDEFAAFAQAASESEAATEEAIENVSARTWTDADLSKLCNEAAAKLGGPQKIIEIRGKYVPEGAAAHTRSIPEDQREAFAQEIEEAAGFEYAG